MEPKHVSGFYLGRTAGFDDDTVGVVADADAVAHPGATDLDLLGSADLAVP